MGRGVCVEGVRMGVGGEEEDWELDGGFWGVKNQEKKKKKQFRIRSDILFCQTDRMF